VGIRYEFGSFAIDKSRFEVERDGKPVGVEPQVFDVLCHLIEHRDRVVTTDELFDTVWAGKIVSDSTLTSRINAARKAIGDDGTAQRWIKTVHRRGYQFIGQPQAALPAQKFMHPRPHLTQDISYCLSGNSVNIAYSKMGDGPPLVKAGNWMNHLEFDLESPIWSHLLAWFATRNTLFRYDPRGNGLSDWDVEDISLDAFVRDLEAVVDKAGLERFALFGASQGCAVSIAYASKHPERVSKMVLYGGFARGRRVRGTPVDVEQAEAMVTLMRTGWGQENPAFRQVFTSLFVPGGTAKQMDWFNDLQRKTTSPDNAVRIRMVSDTLDVSGLLHQVRCPALVLHCRDDAIQPMSEGQFIAAHIPGAKFVSLEGRNHLILESDRGWPKFQEEVADFLSH
jgi:pimeloyl-ACP methyl ester carboxylesterase/DNA-binding winged helix-turn-helix (wHTH) protein